MVRRGLAAARFVAAAIVACAVAPAAAHAQVAPPAVTAFFSQEAATPGADVGLGFTVSNPNAGLALTGVGFSVTLPPGLVISTPSQLFTSCDGTVTAADGGTTLSVSGATLLAADDEAGNSCAVLLDVVAPGPGVVSVTSGAPTSTQSGAGSPSNTTSLSVLAAPTIAETFDDSSILVGETATVTYTLTNPNGSARLYNLAFDDALPAGLAVAPTPNVAATCAPDGVAADPGATTISLLGLQVEAGAQCELSVDVIGTAATADPNPTGPLSFSYDGGGGDLRAATAPGATATLVVVGPPRLTAAFSPPGIARGAASRLTLTLSNPNATTALSGIAFTAALPAGVADATPAGRTSTCASQPTGAAPGTFAVAGVGLAAGASCALGGDVTAPAEGSFALTTSAVSSTDGGVGLPATASLLVVAPPAAPPPPPPPPAVVLPPPPPRLPSNVFKVTNARSDKVGTVRFDVTVAGRGEVLLLETLSASIERPRKSGPSRFIIARKTVRPTKAGKLAVKVTPSARGRRAIRRALRAPKIALAVTFRPTGGQAGSVARRTITVRRR